MNTENNEKYVLNPDYNFRNDVKRAIIIANSSPQCEASNNEWLSYIHPAQAMILSFFSKPTTIENAVGELSSFLSLSNDETYHIIKPFIENPEAVYTEYEGINCQFPKQIIIKYEEHLKINNTYTPEDFIYNELDFDSSRLIKGPSLITIMLTNICVTNCIYCYADRNEKISCQIPFSRIKEMISEAKQLKIKDIHVGGGEFFLYNKWYELLSELKDQGFERNFISTKVPITENDILKLKKFGGITFQFSFDSLSENKITKILGVRRNYVSEMKNTLETMDKHNIPYHVISVLTKLNSDKNDLTEMYNYLSTLKRIKYWQVRIAFKSLYSSTEFESIKLQENERQQVFEHIDELNKQNKLKIDIDKSYLERGYFTAEKGSRSFPGATCTANRSHMYVLPDGNVTICEQMYWKKRFIIGNVLKNSIEEIWNSPAALKWVNFTKDDFRNASACKNCELLDECSNKYPNKCWADVLKVYGDENWDFPDPRCIKAPQLINEII